MENHDRSIKISLHCIKFFFISWAIFVIGGVGFANVYAYYLHNNNSIVFLSLLIGGYVYLFLSLFILIHLYHLVLNISNHIVFVIENIRHLQYLSWLCLFVGIVGCITTIGYFPFLFVGIIFTFISLIIRVIKNVMHQALIIKEENELTI